MNDRQKAALAAPCEDAETLQTAWEKVERFKFNNKLEAHIVILTATENDELRWTTAVRLAHIKKGRYKPVASWSSTERLTVRAMLVNELDGVGDKTRDRSFDTQYAALLQRPVTPVEQGLEEPAPAPEPLPPAPYIPPGANTDPARAMEHLDKLERELESPLILPAGNGNLLN